MKADATFDINVSQWISFPGKKAPFPWTGKYPETWIKKPMPNVNNLKFISVLGILVGTKDVGGVTRYQVDIIGVTFVGSVPGVRPQGLYSDSFMTLPRRLD